MARSRIPKAMLGGPFTLAQAKALGVGAETLRGERFRRLSPHVYVPADLRLDHGTLCRVALLEVPRGVISHASATLAHHLPLGRRESRPSRPRISTRTALPPSSRAYLTNHVDPVPPEHIVETAWGRTTAPARTYVDRARWLPLDDLVVLGQTMLNRRLVTLEELEAMVAWAHGRRGITRARDALRLLADRRAA